MNKKSKPDRAFFLHKQLIQVVDNTKRNFFVMGAILKEIHDNEYYLTMGYDTFTAYLADPDIGVKRSSAYHSMRLVDMFTIEETSGVNYSKLIKIAPLVTDKNKDELVVLAKTLSTSDLNKELKKYKGEKEEESVRHITCPHCGKEFELHE